MTLVIQLELSVSKRIELSTNVKEFFETRKSSVIIVDGFDPCYNASFQAPIVRNPLE